MPRGGARKGAGRKKGIPNRLNAVAKEAFLATFHRLAPSLEKWITQTAEGFEVPLMVAGQPVVKDGGPVMVKTGANPAKAAELLTRMAEYHYPKQAAVAVTGADGGPIEFVIRDLGKEET